ncbi:MAG: SPOR domain-containing protein [Flavobacteriales bacterium]|nr:SPOR domain-containing protein [Flavobacteriales bacterium]
MNQFLKHLFTLLILVSSTFVYAQDLDFDLEKKKPFNPKFTLGTGFYTLTGDIQNEESGFLRGTNTGYNAGMKFGLSDNIDLSFLLMKSTFQANNSASGEDFSSEIDGIGLHFTYTLNQLFKQSKISPLISVGAQSLSFKTEGYVRDNSFAVPFGIGIRINVTDRLEFDAALNWAVGMGDIDKSLQNEGGSDNYKSFNISLHYDLFTPGPNSDDEYFDDSYYADVDFAKLENEDEDGDLVLDVDDYCPKTPIGVKVDVTGCPLDDDNDGIANYLDAQKNTPEGSIVDEHGVRLTADKYHSMYSDYEVASRKYANFYNESEIKRENYKTVDEYLIAKANAFNIAYNEGLKDDEKIKGLVYKVKIGEFSDGIPAKVANKFLSIDDLESVTLDDGVVMYLVGSYSYLDEARGRKNDLEEKGIEDTYLMVDNNGEISDYVEPTPEPEIDEDEVVVEVPEDEISEEVVTTVTEDEMTNETTYRIQVGAFNTELSDEVFVGVDNVISFTGKDGLVRYMAGSFVEYKDAIDYQAQMKARGFEDAFIVTYKNGERISLNVAIKTEKESKVVNQEGKDEVINLEFIVQIMVAKSSLSADDINKIGKLGNFDKEAEGTDMYRYFAGTYNSLEDANIQLEKAKLVGFADAFVFPKLDGERITMERAKELMK